MNLKFWQWDWSWIDEMFGGDKMIPVTVILPSMPQTTPTLSVEPNPDVLTTWDTQKNNYHNARVLCDLSFLTVEEKNLICACLYQESELYNYLPNGQPVTHQNKSVNGVLLSTDWGIAQINDYWHVEKYPDFSSSTDIMANPQKAVQFMIDAYKNGGLNQWVSYSSGAYQKWLSTGSPMWLLANPN